jgi:hypothetical protein
MAPASSSPVAAGLPTHENGDETQRATSPLLPQAKPVVHPVISTAPAGALKSMQWTNSKEPRAPREDIKTRLARAEEDLKKAKEDLKTREMQARARKQKQAKHNAEEELRIKIQSAEEDLRNKIQRAKEDLRVKESVAARRARKNAKREEWSRMQQLDYEKREAKRQENACIKAEAHGAETDGVEMANTGVAEETAAKKEDFDIDLDVDIYVDE